MRVRTAAVSLGAVASLLVAWKGLGARPPQPAGGEPGRTAAAAAREPKLSELLALTQVGLGGFGGGGAGGAEEKAEPPVATVHLALPVTPRAAKVWEKLGQPVNLSFPHETPFEDVLKFIKNATAGPKDKGLSIYVDPVGLQEAERTTTSPVTIDLDDVPLGTGLTLILKQLGLRYYVHPDGILMVTSESNEDVPAEPVGRVLDELSSLRREVENLRREMEIVYRRGPNIYSGPPNASGPAAGGMGGGMR